MKGIYKGDELSNNDYHGEKDHFSSSNIKDLISTVNKWNSPVWGVEKFYKEKVLHEKEPQKEKAVFSEGSLVHGMILEPHLVDEEFVCFDGFRKAGKVWQAFQKAEKEGKNRTILSKPQWMRCLKMVENFNKNKTAVELVKSCSKELSLFGELDGIPIKVRADCINIEEGYIVDIKTSSYDVDLDSFKFTMKDCEVYKISKGTREKGDRKVFEDLKKYKECSKTVIWKNEKKSLLTVREYDNYEIKEV